VYIYSRRSYRFKITGGFHTFKESRNKRSHQYSVFAGSGQTEGSEEKEEEVPLSISQQQY
jgi:hypothetical protein